MVKKDERKQIHCCEQHAQRTRALVFPQETTRKLKKLNQWTENKTLNQTYYLSCVSGLSSLACGTVVWCFWCGVDLHGCV